MNYHYIYVHVQMIGHMNNNKKKKKTSPSLIFKLVSKPQNKSVAKF